MQRDDAVRLLIFSSSSRESFVGHATNAPRDARSSRWRSSRRDRGECCWHPDRRRSPVRMPAELLRLRRGLACLRPDRPGIEPCGQLAALPTDIARTGNGCGPTRTRLCSGATPSRRHVDGVRCQLKSTLDANSRAVTARLYRRQPARDVTAIRSSNRSLAIVIHRHVAAREKRAAKVRSRRRRPG